MKFIGYIQQDKTTGSNFYIPLLGICGCWNAKGKLNKIIHAFIKGYLEGFLQKEVDFKIDIKNKKKFEITTSCVQEFLSFAISQHRKLNKIDLKKMSKKIKLSSSKLLWNIETSKQPMNIQIFQQILSAMKLDFEIHLQDNKN